MNLLDLVWGLIFSLTKTLGEKSPNSVYAYTFIPWSGFVPVELSSGVTVSPIDGSEIRTENHMGWLKTFEIMGFLIYLILHIYLIWSWFAGFLSSFEASGMCNLARLRTAKGFVLRPSAFHSGLYSCVEHGPFGDFLCPFENGDFHGHSSLPETLKSEKNMMVCK